MSENFDQFSFNNPMPPPWLMYPDFGMSCMGWRMGLGESYLDVYFRWMETLDKDELKTYKILFPAPYDWLGYWDDNLNGDEESIRNKEQDYNFYTNNNTLVEFRKKDGMPEYDINKLRQDYKNGMQKELLLFWGHQPSRDGMLTISCFSQWWKAGFDDAQTFCCSEQYMMAEKSKFFGDKETYDEILACSDPKTMKSLGKKVKPFNEAEWNRVKYSIVLKGNYLRTR